MLRTWRDLGRFIFATPVRIVVTIAVAVVAVICLISIKLIIIAALWQVIGALLVIAIPFVAIAWVLGWRPGK
jgi:glucose-6-phosphate-specific signal transduction histidine kinase